jgi:hypothetical protein
MNESSIAKNNEIDARLKRLCIVFSPRNGALFV